MWKASLPAPLVRFVAPHVGSVVTVEDLSNPGGNAATYRVRGDARTVILKAHRSERAFRQELKAYRVWAPEVAHTPALLGHRDEPPHALVVEALPGVPLSSLALPAADERGLHGGAGAWLRTLHALPFRDRDPLPLEEAYRRRIRAWGAAAPGGDLALCAWIEARLDDLPSRLRGAARVPCHLDFEPRNWLVGEDGRWLAAIDFEHARPDHPLADLTRLAAYVWPARADLADAFLSTYAGPVGEIDFATVDRLAVFEAARRLAWAARHGDGPMERSARAALAARGGPVGS